MIKKGFAGIIVVVLITIILGGYLFVQKARQPASNITQSSPIPNEVNCYGDEGNIEDFSPSQKIYTNSKFGIQYRFPNTYKHTIEYGYIRIESPVKSNIKSAGYAEDELLIEIYCNPSKINDSLEEIVGDVKEVWQTAGIPEEVKTSTMKIDGVNAVKIYNYNEGYSIDFINNDFRFSIRKYPEKTSRENEFEQFINSIKLK